MKYDYIVWEIDKETKARIVICGQRPNRFSANLYRAELRKIGVLTEIEAIERKEK